MFYLCVFFLVPQDSCSCFSEGRWGCTRKRSSNADRLYQDMSDPGIQNKWNQMLGNTMTISALLSCSASFFFYDAKIGKFCKKILLWLEGHQRKPPLSLTKNLLSICFSFLSPIFKTLFKELIYTGIFIAKNASIIQGARGNPFIRQPECVSGILLLCSLAEIKAFLPVTN